MDKPGVMVPLVRLSILPMVAAAVVIKASAVRLVVLVAAAVVIARLAVLRYRARVTTVVQAVPRLAAVVGVARLSVPMVHRVQVVQVALAQRLALMTV